MSAFHSISGIASPRTHAHTVQWAGFKGMKNGELLQAAELAGYGVLLTIDQGIPYQQDFGGRRLSIILIHSQTNRIEDLLPLADEILQAMETIQPGQTVTIPLKKAEPIS